MPNTKQLTHPTEINPSNESKILSKNKLDYIKHNSALSPFYAYRGFRLKGLDLTELSTHYYNKYKAIIYLNGDTLHGQNILRTKMREDELQVEVGNLTDNKMKYAHFFLTRWYQPNGCPSEVHASVNLQSAAWEADDPFISTHRYSVFKNNYYYLRFVTRAFFSWFGMQPNQNLTVSEKYQLNEIIRNLSFKSLFDQAISKAITMAEERCYDPSLSEQEAFEEIKFIQKDLSAHDAVGYIYSNWHRRKDTHYEVLIITRDRIIKPIKWFLGLMSIQSGFFYSPLPDNKYHHPQSDGESCGTLGILYLKQLLKNDAYQLRYLTLCFDYYDRNGKLLHGFIPSPQVLAYSQSEMYNQIILASLDLVHEVTTLKYNDREIQVNSLISLLKESVEIIENKLSNIVDDDELNKKLQVTLQENEIILKKLPEFIQNWLKEFDSMMVTRSLMFDKNYNRYLVYCSSRMFKVVNDKRNYSENTETVTTEQFTKIKLRN